MEDKISNSSQISSTESETILTEFEFEGLNNFVEGFIKNLIISILRAEDKPAKFAAQGKNFTTNVEKNAERATKIISPDYVKRLQELGFPEKTLTPETHEKEIKKLLKKEGFLK